MVAIEQGAHPRISWRLHPLDRAGGYKYNKDINLLQVTSLNRTITAHIAARSFLWEEKYERLTVADQTSGYVPGAGRLFAAAAS
jgi:hypothetical protein